MTILRRYYDLALIERALDDTYASRAEVLVTFDTDTGDLHVGVRGNPWDPWSTPLIPTSAADDAPGPGGRSYPTGGRSYVPTLGEAFAVVDAALAPEATVEIGGQTMTLAQYDAARRPLLDPDPGPVAAPVAETTLPGSPPVAPLRLTDTGGAHGDVVADLRRAQES